LLFNIGALHLTGSPEDFSYSRRHFIFFGY
jgi:hypothetical protein